MQNFVKSGAQSRVRFFLVLLIAFLIVFFLVLDLLDW